MFHLLSCAAPATPVIYTLSLHDALPIWPSLIEAHTIRWVGHFEGDPQAYRGKDEVAEGRRTDPVARLARLLEDKHRSEEHTSELQSLTNLVCRLLLEKKKKTKKRDQTAT